MGFTCSVCGEYHAERLLDIRLGLPDAIHALAADERLQRTWLADDFAVLDDERFFVRGLLELPIPELAGRFGYGAWVEVARHDFQALLTRWHSPEQFEPVACTLANELTPYSGTAALEATLRATSADTLPVIELGSAGHALVRDQREGITAARSDELAAPVLHAS